MPDPAFARRLQAVVASTAVLLVTACDITLTIPSVNYTGEWRGQAEYCPDTPQTCRRHDASMQLVQLDSIVTGLLQIDGLIDSLWVAGSQPSWDGLNMTARASCATMTGSFEFDAEGISFFSDVTFDWSACPEQDVEVWHLFFYRRH